MKVQVTDLDGAVHQFEGDPSLSLMENIREAGLPILALCGGCCSCSTCHVYVDSAWADRLPPRGEDEEDTLDQALELRETSRLACQITLTEALDGLAVTLSEDTRDD